jgi:hypothetical protein
MSEMEREGKIEIKVEVEKLILSHLRSRAPMPVGRLGCSK